MGDNSVLQKKFQKKASFYRIFSNPKQLSVLYSILYKTSVLQIDFKILKVGSTLFDNFVCSITKNMTYNVLAQIFDEGDTFLYQYSNWILKDLIHCIIIVFFKHYYQPEFNQFAFQKIFILIFENALHKCSVDFFKSYVP